MHLIIDTHVHLYPCYDLALALRCLDSNLSQLAPDAVKIALLAERHDCHVFTKLASGSIDLTGDGIQVSTSGEEGALVLNVDDGNALYLLSGRQIVTEERIEILGVAMAGHIEDGLAAADTISAVLAGNGVPILSWAPGKWFFGRGKVVDSVLAKFGPGKIIVGDTTLRPTIWPEPRLMQKAARDGIGIVAGSDPLPFAGEEVRAGTYASIVDCDFSGETPLTDVRNALLGAGREERVGDRSSVLTMLSRLKQNAAAK
jgi:hypothetical protein